MTDKLPIQTYFKDIQKNSTIKIKLRHYFEILIPETRKLLGSNERRITKDKNLENGLRIKISEIYCQNANNQFQRD